MMKGRGRGTLLEPISDFTLQKDALEYLNAEKETKERGGNAFPPSITIPPWATDALTAID